MQAWDPVCLGGWCRKIEGYRASLRSQKPKHHQQTQLHGKHRFRGGTYGVLVESVYHAIRGGTYRVLVGSVYHALRGSTYGVLVGSVCL